MNTSLSAKVFPLPFVAALNPNEQRASIVRAGDGHFPLLLDTSTTIPWLLEVSAPGLISNYITELQTTAVINGQLPSVKLPSVGNVRICINIPTRYSAEAADLNWSVSARKTIILGDGDDMLRLAGSSSGILQGSTVTATISNLPEGEYWLETEAEGSGAGGDKMSSPVQVQANTTTTIEQAYGPFQPEKMRGKGEAQVHVKKQDGAPAGALKYVVRYLDRDFGYQTFTTGTLDESGATQLHEMATTGYSLKDGGTTAPRFEISVFTQQEGDGYYGGVCIGRIQFDTVETSRTFEFTVPPRAGDVAPDITLIDPYTSETIALSSLRGQVVFLDFWSTWCGPCQGPMAHNQKVMTQKEDSWKGKAVIVGASIDNDTETLLKHVKQHGWEKVRQLWCGGDFQSIPSQTFGIDSVPIAFLIDQSGKIIWRGHPEAYEIEAEVEKMLGI